MADIEVEVYQEGIEIDVEVVKKTTEIEVEVISVTPTGSGGMQYKIGNGLRVVDNTLEVDAAEKVEEDNTLPITSAAVYTTVGNIEALLGTI